MGGQTPRRGQPLTGGGRPIRLHFVITDLQIGGTPRVVRDLADRLRPLGYAPAVTCLAPWGPVADEIRSLGIPVNAVGITGAKHLPRAVSAVRRATADADVIYALLFHANLVCGLANAGRTTPLFMSIQTTQPKPAWHWWLHAAVTRAAERVIVPTPSAAQVATERSGVAPDRIAVIPNAVDATPVQRDSNASAVWRIGFVGRLDPVKRVPDLVAAVAMLPTSRLDLFGDGIERVTIERAVRRHGIADRVTLHGSVTSAAVALARVDVLVLPSEAEGFGLVLIEAMAAGVPVVGTDVPGVRDVIRHGENGLLVPAGRPDRIAAAIERIRLDARLRDRLIEGGRRDVRERYGWAAVIDRYDRLFRASVSDAV